MLDSVVPLIDSYCICDTGSTDDTISIIRDFFAEKNIPGKVVEHPFQNFRDTRNAALHSCIGMSDFVLLMDADMILDIRKDPYTFKQMLLSCDHMTICQGSESYFYKNTRIVRNNGIYAYVGVTHEYIGSGDVPGGMRGTHADTSLIFINDIGDGGCKADKFERDARLLEEGISAEPNNIRYHFYLANTYMALNRPDDAIEYYRKRISMKGWEQEVWYSYYNMGICWHRKGTLEGDANALVCFWEAYLFMPTRIENLYEIVKHYNHHKKYELAKSVYTIAAEIIRRENNTATGRRERELFLFVHNGVYNYDLGYEFITFADKVGVSHVNDEIVASLNWCRNKGRITNLFYNMKFYNFVLPQTSRISFDDTRFLDRFGGVGVADTDIEFYSSSSCLLKIEEEETYMMNVRYVAYTYHPTNGSYSGPIVTRNKCIMLNSELQPLPDHDATCFLEEPTMTLTAGKWLLGIEDLRISRQSGSCSFMGTGLHANGKIGIVYGTYNTPLIPAEIKPTFADESCEKNWVFTGLDENNLHQVVYKWYPLQLCRICTPEGHASPQEPLVNGNIEGEGVGGACPYTLEKITTREMPHIFEHARGSSTGFVYHQCNEIWFVVHLVSYETPRHYYHMIAVFDMDMQLQRYSAPFKFEGECIEFCLSIVVEENRTLINYSTMDRTTRIGVYDTDYLNKSVVTYTP